MLSCRLKSSFSLFALIDWCKIPGGFHSSRRRGATRWARSLEIAWNNSNKAETFESFPNTQWDWYGYLHEWLNLMVLYMYRYIQGAFAASRIECMRVFVNFDLFLHETLPETNSSPLKIGQPLKGNIIFQPPLVFRDFIPKKTSKTWFYQSYHIKQKDVQSCFVFKLRWILIPRPISSLLIESMVMQSIQKPAGGPFGADLGWLFFFSNDVY